MQITQSKTQSTTVSSFAEIRECLKTGNKFLYATVKFRAGEAIGQFNTKEICDRPNYLTVQKGDRQHIMLNPEFLHYINHSCNPNVFFDTDRGIVTALQNIEMGEQLTFFYPSTEWSMAQAFYCLCQSDSCLGYIQGAAHLPINVLTQYKLSQYIAKKIRV